MLEVICTIWKGSLYLTENWLSRNQIWYVVDDIQILTAQEDDGGNYHSRGAIHTGPTIIPKAKRRG